MNTRLYLIQSRPARDFSAGWRAERVVVGSALANAVIRSRSKTDRSRVFRAVDNITEYTPRVSVSASAPVVNLIF